MESDSDSDGSHISATPPRRSPSPLPPPPPPTLSSCKSRVRVRVSANPRSELKRKSRTPKSNPSKEDDPPPLPSIDLSSLPGFSVKIQRPSDRNQATSASFSRTFKTRRSAFDPSEFENDSVTANHVVGDRAASVDQVKVVKRHPNSIGCDATSEKPIRAKSNTEGNFVRLRINGYSGYGRKFTNKGQRFSSHSSRRFKYRRRSNGGSKSGREGDIGSGLCEEEGLVTEVVSKQEAVVAARAEPSDRNLIELMKLTHGYDCFREGQLEAIRGVLSGESMMLVLPTGAGKSLCYQLTALILPGLTLVVSPLVALMVDQLRQLPPTIPGGILSSSQFMNEYSYLIAKVVYVMHQVLFVSPERFLNAEFLSIVRDGPLISLVVIDEAHCLSEWSHNFRPAYFRLKSSILLTELNAKCVLAMTATATVQTLHDVMHALDIRPKNLIQNCQIRENLQLFVTISINRMKDLLILMKSSHMAAVRSIIIYCKFQSETDQISKYLCDNNITAKSYHSGIPALHRSRTQELFCSNKIRVVVATVAFGMGLDKSDVGAVIHYSLPESIEEYIQENGRAGRDGRLSHCHLLLDDNTYYKLRSLSYSDGIDEYTINKFLCQIFNNDTSVLGDICSLVKESASRKFDMKEEVMFTILTQLELGETQYVRLLPQLNVTCTLHFHKTSPGLLSDKDMLVAMILKKSETKQGHYVFDIPTIANCVGVTTIDVSNQLLKLKLSGEITYELKDPSFCYVIAKKPEDVCSLATYFTRWLSDVESHKVRKLDAMFKIASFAATECKKDNGCSDSLHTSCMNRNISDYFSGGCDVLLAESVNKMSKSSPFLRADIKVFLQSNAHAKFTPRAVARIMHGIPSPAFPSAMWSKCHFWGRYTQIDFPVVMEAATLELMNFMGKSVQ
ncbi:ATP-dependent DNA helicase Q-like 5 [Acorus gramineus]|uniref:DNA 3'-5' helicase n=1 Tax=Acorus gramineus TaxID=55184 RepID=A0AAV9B5L8_ACOGR|nr:ATP-dependent DNA helicase Q-like 5 [Acorus gramineus]